MSITAYAEEFALAVNGIDWDASRVQQAWNAMTEAAQDAETADLNAALDVLCRRIEAWDILDSDGTAMAALRAGALVESGGSARRLAIALLAKLPGVLAGARRYADLCLGDPATRSAAESECEDEDILTEVDRVAISREVFRSRLTTDRPDACCLSYLRNWVMPTVAALTRDREMLKAARQDQNLVQAAWAMRDSDAHWLNVLLQCEIEATWLVLCPTAGRGFWVGVDGVADNFTLHALLAGALTQHGIPDSDANSPELLAYLRGESDVCPTNHVNGAWNLYDHRAASMDLTRASEVDQSAWVWGEGRPWDVPMIDGIRTLLVGPQSYQRSWNPRRTFEALPANVWVMRELPATEVQSRLAALARGQA